MASSAAGGPQLREICLLYNSLELPVTHMDVRVILNLTASGRAMPHLEAIYPGADLPERCIQ